MNKCKECGSTNMLMKRGKDWLCLSCFSKTKPVESELEKTIEECVKYGLIYISGMYRKKLRKLEKEKLENEEI